MEFQTKVCGIPCTVVVTLYRKAVPMRIYGSGMGDCDPPEPKSLNFTFWIARDTLRSGWKLS